MEIQVQDFRVSFNLLTPAITSGWVDAATDRAGNALSGAAKVLLKSMLTPDSSTCFSSPPRAADLVGKQGMLAAIES